MRKSKKGNEYRLGMKHTDETIRKMSESHKNISDETRQQMSDSGRKRVTVNKTSQYKNVSWHTGDKRFITRIRFNGKKLYLGGFKDEYDAHLAVVAFKKENNIQLDPVYTGKMMYGIFDLLKKGYFKKGSKILAIHTGGLQGITGMNTILRQKKLPIID